MQKLFHKIFCTASAAVPSPDASTLDGGIGVSGSPAITTACVAPHGHEVPLHSAPHAGHLHSATATDALRRPQQARHSGLHDFAPHCAHTRPVGCAHAPLSSPCSRRNSSLAATLNAPAAIMVCTAARLSGRLRCCRRARWISLIARHSAQNIGHRIMPQTARQDSPAARMPAPRVGYARRNARVVIRR